MSAGGRKIRLLIGIPIGVLAILATIVAVVLYSWVYRPSLVNLSEDEDFLYISTGSDYNDLCENLDSLQWLKNSRSFDWVAQKKNLPAHIHPGRYSVFKGMSNDSLVNLLRSGQQSELLLTFKSVRTFEYLAQLISVQLELDSISLINCLNDPELIDSLGFTQETWMGMFLPNSYRFYWNTDAKGFILRMNREYRAFWNQDRKKRLEEIGLDENELMTLASIVQDETAREKDMSRIAGIYMNRLKKRMKLQSCPTVIYAWGEPRIRRLLNKHLKIKSPYNTYIHRGLPPGPIRIPSIQAIKACLYYEHNDFLYFSAKEDFSGETVYAKSYAQHLRNARKYQKALNSRKIY